MLLTKESSSLLHEQVREHLREKYFDGSYEALPSLRELSQQLEINHSTISRALRDLEREGVVEIIPRKGIFPKRPAAPAPRGNELEMVVLYDETHEQLEVAKPIFAGMQQACQDDAGEMEALPCKVNRSLLPICPVPAVDSFLNQLETRGVAGVVFFGFGYLEFPASLEESRFIYEVSRHLPVVLAGTQHAQLELDCVYCDPRPQMREFLEQCYTNGKRRFEFLGDGTAQPHQAERHEEFCNFLMGHGLAWNREFLSEEPVETLAARLRQVDQLPEVIVATNTSRAITVALEAQQRGLRLPQDLQLLTFASVESHAQPILPYANVLLLDEPAVGERAWHMLRHRIQHGGQPVLERVPARFISRH